MNVESCCQVLEVGGLVYLQSIFVLHAPGFKNHWNLLWLKNATQAESFANVTVHAGRGASGS